MYKTNSSRYTTSTLDAFIFSVTDVAVAAVDGC